MNKKEKNSLKELKKDLKKINKAYDLVLGVDYSDLSHKNKERIDSVKKELGHLKGSLNWKIIKITN